MSSVQKLLSRKQLKEIIPYSTMQIYRLEKAGEFPKRVKIGKQRVAWLEADVQKWIESKLMGAENGVS
ncbi:MAG: AlpA family phage regulatory protein [Alphaproteobacteria bacterium]|nr:AlpA family phage regulatory protein [Alphaproteobacteria bacterium]